ncbi:alpha/beta hydrolase [Mycolicibacterium sp.]|uniref:alpha/beta hydrolase n=1 Tax=Mycolicibacterium sp. TaxID=2320850 RepID=UPI0025E87BF3|nr:alpha/beta hydrolase [Mycolicibacterium sp.]
MAVDLRGVVTVLLPGTGSDDDYLRRAFAGPLRRAGAILVAVRPVPDDLLAGYADAVEAAAAEGPIAVGGVSLGAAFGATWALANPARTVAVLAALPPWTGPPQDAPAALSARHTATALRRDGLDAVTAAMRASSPGWLADELERSWRRQWPGLPDAMEAAAGYPAPDTAALRRLSAPMGVVGSPDDAVHPLEVAEHWAKSAPRAALRTVTFEEFGPHPEALGAACLAALQDC